VSLFGGLEIGRKALTTHQAVLDTVGHNLANVATPGYARQRAELVAVAPRNGVEVAQIRRLRDRFLDVQLVQEQGLLGRAQARVGLLQRLETIFTEHADTGLGALLGRFFAAFQDLSVHPTDQALRVTVKDTGEQLAGTFRDLRARLDVVRTDLVTEIESRVSTANSLVAEIAELNRRVVAARGGGLEPSDLLDRRDLLVARLSEIVGVVANDNENGSVRVTVAGTGVRLVDGDLVSPLAVSVDGSTNTVRLAVGAEVVVPASGALAALLDARNSPTGPIAQAARDLDVLARSIIDEVNRIHAGGAGLTEHTTLTAGNPVSSATVPLDAAGLPGTPVTGAFTIVVHDGAGAVVSTVEVPVTAGVTTLDDLRAAIDVDPNLTATISAGALTLSAGAGMTFVFAEDSSDTLMALGLNTFFTGTDAGTIAVSSLVTGDVGAIAAARADSTGLVHPGAGENALALARLRTALTLGGGTTTFVDFLGTLISRVGSQSRDAARGLDRQEAAVQLVESFRQQASGVSTDEELLALTQAQYAYAAAARYISTVTDVIETLFQITR
jgi:flagellar hook-associated protein 1 FlgK